MNFNKKGLTLLEIITSTIILALVMAGMTNVFVSGKKYIQHSRYRMTGSEIGRIFVDPFQAYVREDTWSSNPLGTNSQPSESSGVYTASYTISDLATTSIKKVKTTISWIE